MSITCVFLAAGISSRFGGRIKALAKVGPAGESLVEYSMQQAKQAGFDRFVVIVSKNTYDPIHAKLGDEYLGCKVIYTYQETPAYREKPLGWGHALLSCKGVLNGPFCVCSTDDIFGQETFNKMFNHLKHEDTLAIPGYVLRNCVPPTGKVNRAILRHIGDQKLTHIEEHFDIEHHKLGSEYTGDEHAAMLMYGLHSNFISYVDKKFVEFLEANPDEKRKEFLLPSVMNDWVKQNPSTVHVFETSDTPLFLTFPEDEEIVRNKLSNH